MHVFKWWLTVELYLGAALASAAGHSNLAIAVAIAAIAATLAALELGDVEPDDDEPARMTVERLAVVLVYALQQHNWCREPAHPIYVEYCRRVAIGLSSC